MGTKLREKRRASQARPELIRLYQSDRVGWLDRMVALIKQRRYRDLDYSNLRRYLLYWMRRDRQEVRYRLVTLLTNLLKIKFGPKRDSRKMEVAALKHQFELQDIVESPSLKRVAEKVLPGAYAAACRSVAATVVPAVRLPTKPLYMLDDLLRDDLIPTNG